MKILVLNAGSSSLKFNLFEASPEAIDTNSEKVLAKGQVERVASMAEALQAVFQQVGAHAVDALGHRIVHGGDRFHESVIIDEAVEKQIDELSDLRSSDNIPK